MLRPMSEERRVQEQEEARRVLSPVRLAVLLLLGALFLVLGGSRADAAEAGTPPAKDPSLLAGTLDAVDAGPALTAVGKTVDGVVDPVLTATGPVVEPVVEPVVRPVVEPVVTPLRPVVERVVAPVGALPVTELVAPVATGSDRPAPPAHGTVEARTEAAPGSVAAAVDTPHVASSAAQVAVPRTVREAPTSGMPVSRPASTTTDNGTGTPVPYAVLLTAFVAVLLLAGGVAPGRVAPPLAPTFLPPVFPG